MNTSTARVITRLSAYSLLILLQLTIAGCSPPPPAEASIRKALDTMSQAVENNDPAPIVERLHGDFDMKRSGEPLNRFQAVHLLRFTLKRFRHISVTLTNIRVSPDSVRKDTATATFNALVTGSNNRFLPQTGQLYRVESTWRLDGGEWKLLHMESKRALESG